MRITHSVITQNFNRNLSNNLSRMQKYYDQLTTGKEITKPSDNPLLVGKIMALDTSIKQNETHNKTIEDSLSWIATQDTALQSANDSLLRIRDLMIQGATGTLSEDDRQAVHAEVRSQMEHFVDVLNTNYDGRYVFAGQETLTRPFELEKTTTPDGAELVTGIKYNGNKENLPREIALGVSINLITDGSKFLGSGSGSDASNNIGSLFKEVSQALHEGTNLEKVGGDYLEFIDKFSDETVRVRTEIGAVGNRLESAKERNISENLHLKKSLSAKEDVDIPEKYMEFLTMSTVYQASLSVGAKIMQPTLLDYIR